MSNLFVCRDVQLNNTYEHTIFFDSQESRDIYFDSKVVASFDEMSYLRKQWDIKVQAPYASARSWTYAFTVDGSHPRYYYFITDIEYISPNTVKLRMELDVMMTYIHTYRINKSFVERMHVTNDGIGVHTVEEGLELGDYVASNINTDPFLQELCVLIQTTVDLTTVQVGENEEDTRTSIAGTAYNKVFSGVAIQAVSTKHFYELATKLLMLTTTNEEIISMWMYPKELVELQDGYTWTDDNVIKKVVGFKTEQSFETSRNESPQAYTPRNNKLLTYPYNFLYVSNNSGQSANYPYERFGDPDHIRFRYTGALNPSDGVKVFPLNYKGEIYAYEHGLSLPPFPTCAWQSDTYKLWLAQNQGQINNAVGAGATTTVAGVVTGVMGMLSGNIPAIVGGAVTAFSGLSSIGSQLARVNDSQAMPVQAKGNFSTSTNITAGFQSFTIAHKGITTERMRIIDDFFDVYGYKIMRMTLPMIHARESWSYVKTVGANVSGNIPNDDLTKIKSIFDKGITFWVNGDKIGDYSQSNKPI